MVATVEKAGYTATVPSPDPEPDAESEPPGAELFVFDPDELERPTDALGEVVGLGDELAGDAAADDTAPEQGDAKGGLLVGGHRTSWSGAGSSTSRASRSSIVSRRTMTRATPSRTAITGGRGVWLYWLDRLRQ